MIWLTEGSLQPDDLALRCKIHPHSGRYLSETGHKHHRTADGTMILLLQTVILSTELPFFGCSFEFGLVGKRVLVLCYAYGKFSVTLLLEIDDRLIGDRV